MQMNRDSVTLRENPCSSKIIRNIRKIRTEQKTLKLSTMKKYVKQILMTLLTALAIGLSVLLTSCNVTRTVTTTSSSVKRGDTTVIIQSKTIESYDASKRL